MPLCTAQHCLAAQKVLNLLNADMVLLLAFGQVAASVHASASNVKLVLTVERA